jgi:hypothetical protein
LVAQLSGVTLDDFIKNWPEKVQAINAIQSQKFPWFDIVGYPTEFGAKNAY